MTIYELKEGQLRLKALLEDSETPDEAIQAEFECYDGALEAKAEDYWMVYKQLEGDKAAIEAEKKRLVEGFDAKISTLNKSLERLSKTVETMMRETGKLKFETEYFKFGIRKNPAKLVINKGIKATDIPFEYVKTKDPEINNDAVKKALKDGVKLEWAHLEQTERLDVR